MKTKGLTLDQHREIGAQLKEMTAYTQRLVVDLEKAYSGESSPAVAAKRIEGLLWELRSDLEGQMSHEHGSEDTSVYYGGRND